MEGLHTAGLIHRDLTPSNVMVRPEGSICLLDLELACEIGSDEPPFTQGTPGFMSPQQSARNAPELQDDVFALGALASLLLSGIDPRRVLFVRESDRLRQIEELTGAPAELCSLIAACLADRPRDRPHLAEVANDIPSCGSRARATAGA